MYNNNVVIVLIIGLVRRKCVQNNTWGDVEGVHNCYSTEFSALFDDTVQLKRYYYGDDDLNIFDFREISLLDLLTVSSELSSLTNSSQPLPPQDLISANDVMDTIIRYILTNTTITVKKCPIHLTIFSIKRNKFFLYMYIRYVCIKCAFY